jgi:phage gp29-like protein
MRPPQRSGYLRTAIWWSWFKSLTVRDWVAFAERFGLPYPIGKYDPMEVPRFGGQV